MRKTTFLILLFLFFVSLLPKSYSQDPLSFYPLKVGNKYVYEHWSQYLGCSPQWFIGHTVITIDKDTVFQNGKRYFHFNNYWDSRYKYQRVDSTTKNVYFFDINEGIELMLDSLAALQGNSYDGWRNTNRIGKGSPWPYVNNIYTYSIFNQTRQVKRILADGLIVAEYELAEGIGLSFMMYCHHNDGVRWVLKGCVINDTLYGDTTLTSLNNISSEIPVGFNLYNNYPNPFNPSTNIKFDVPVRGNVSLRIYNNLGKEITTLVNNELSPGTYEIFWDASAFSSGVYFYRMEALGFSQTKRMLLIK